MLSLFPQILFLAPFSALLIRITLAIILGLTAWKHFAIDDTLKRALAVVEVIIAAAIIVGAWTQAAALIAFGIGLVWFAFPSTRTFPLSTVIVCMVLALSLLVTGAGAFAFDLPL